MFRSALAAAAAAALVLAAASVAAFPSQVDAATTPHFAPAGCDAVPAGADARQTARCYALIHTDGGQHVAADTGGPPSAALGPADIQSAYHLPAGGAGMTVAVVDAGGYATAESDLATFRDHYGLPPCTTANGCFRKVDQRGGAVFPPEDGDWAVETALDLDAVSSACPQCHILLVEGDTAGLDDLGSAVDTAVRLGAQAVSNSYGVPGETPLAPSLDHYYDHPGVAVTVSTGDTGNVVSWPASSPTVMSVGGTTLTRDPSTTRGWSETAWAHGGSGCSKYEPRPAFQQGRTTGCPDHRATADVGADADPDTGLAVYTTDHGGWLQVGGTSLSSPLAAAMVALAGAPLPGTYPVTYPYRDGHAADLNDVTSGGDGTCGTVLCTAGPGWDGPTGLGTPAGIGALSFGPHGSLTGVVCDAHHRTPLSAATLSARNTTTGETFTATTDRDGRYSLTAAAGAYDLTVSRFGYVDSTERVTVADGATVRRDVALVPAHRRVLSGVVRDGSGHGWPMYARIDVDGDPDGPAFTDPHTGRYRISLPVPSTYHLHVTAAAAPGYLPTELSVAMGRRGRRLDPALHVDPSTCSAPGYAFHYDAATEDFTDWAGTTPRDGWSNVANNGNDELWSFDNPRHRPLPPGGDTHFAVADSSQFSWRTVQNMSLVSPPVDLSGVDHPEIGFDTDYEWFFGAAVLVDVSTDGGTTWTNVWTQLPSIAGHIDLPIPAAAHQRDVRVRFTYTGHQNGYWSVDDVFVGSRSCVPVRGSLVRGFVRGLRTHRGIAGASVTNTAAPDQSTTTVSSPAGYYVLFVSPPGRVTLTAEHPGYAPATAHVACRPDRAARRDWYLRPRS